MDSFQLRFLDFLRAHCAGIRDPGNRWGLFAVAASGLAVSSQQAVDLYVARLRKRRASPVIFSLDQAPQGYAGFVYPHGWLGARP